MAVSRTRWRVADGLYRSRSTRLHTWSAAQQRRTAALCKAWGQGRMSAALWERDTARMRAGPAETAEEWQGAAAQKSRPSPSLAEGGFLPRTADATQRAALWGAKPSAPACNRPPSSQTEGSLSPKTLSKETPSTSPFGSNLTETTRGLADSINLRKLRYNTNAAVDFSLTLGPCFLGIQRDLQANLLLHRTAMFAASNVSAEQLGKPSGRMNTAIKRMHFQI